MTSEQARMAERFLAGGGAVQFDRLWLTKEIEECEGNVLDREIIEAAEAAGKIAVRVCADGQTFTTEVFDSVMAFEAAEDAFWRQQASGRGRLAQWDALAEESPISTIEKLFDSLSPSRKVWVKGN